MILKLKTTTAATTAASHPMRTVCQAHREDAHALHVCNPTNSLRGWDYHTPTLHRKKEGSTEKLKNLLNTAQQTTGALIKYL